MTVAGHLHIGPVAAAAACTLVAQAMRDNPTHVAVFGPDAELRQQRLHVFFSTVLPWIARHGRLLAAVDAGTQGPPVGVFGLLPPGRCRPAPLQALRLASRILRQQGPATGTRCLRWLRAWQAHDPPIAHWHLGPLAVAPARQGQGIGTALLRHGLAQATATPCHLETDLPRNVALYQRLGFSVVAQHAVLGAPNWFMQRRSDAARQTQTG